MIINALGGEHVTDAVVITVSMSDGTSAAGRVVTVWNVDDDVEFEHFTYSGQPHTSNLPVGMHAEIRVDEVTWYATPAPVRVYALGGVPRSVMLEYTRGVRYGFKREKANSAPDARITYLYDAEGMTPAYMDFEADAFNWGDWKDFVEKVARPVMLKTDGTVDYELDHDDQTRKLDGTASDVANVDYDGNAMVEFGKAFQWVKRYEDSEFEYVIFCDVRFDDSYHAYAHTNEAGDVQDAFYWGMYEGRSLSSLLRSIGTGGATVNINRTAEMTLAGANGQGYLTTFKSGWDYICNILKLISRNDNAQEAFGVGCAGVSGALACGTTKARGAFYGTNSGTSKVKVLWIEDFWGNHYEGLAGFMLDGANGIKVKMVPPYNVTGEGYVETGIVPIGTSGGYVKSARLTDNGYIPNETGGSATTYECDMLRYSTSLVAYALAGGAYGINATYAGPRALVLDTAPSTKSGTIGSRLTFISS